MKPPTKLFVRDFEAENPKATRYISTSHRIHDSDLEYQLVQPLVDDSEIKNILANYRGMKVRKPLRTDFYPIGQKVTLSDLHPIVENTEDKEDALAEILYLFSRIEEPKQP